LEKVSVADNLFPIGAALYWEMIAKVCPKVKIVDHLEIEKLPRNLQALIQKQSGFFRSKKPKAQNAQINETQRPPSPKNAKRESNEEYESVKQPPQNPQSNPVSPKAMEPKNILVSQNKEPKEEKEAHSQFQGNAKPGKKANIHIDIQQKTLTGLINRRNKQGEEPSPKNIEQKEEPAHLAVSIQPPKRSRNLSATHGQKSNLNLVAVSLTKSNLLPKNKAKARPMTAEGFVRKKRDTSKKAEKPEKRTKKASNTGAGYKKPVELEEADLIQQYQMENIFYEMVFGLTKSIMSDE
jgi:hypothetical protein